MNLAKLVAGRERYYLDSVAAGREDHRPPGLEPDGVWLGAGAAQLVLTGTVSGHDLTEVLRGIHPGTGKTLNPAQGRVRVAAFDLTFAAPKSVSVLFGLADDHVGAEIRRAHEAAVADALAYLERQAVGVRRRGGGRRWSEGTTGLVAAGFTHRTSRSLDPHLHTHVLVANLAMGRDGRWSALDARGLYAHARTAGFLYQGRLRHELVDRLGLELGPVRHGVANLAGMDPAVTAHFSQRRVQVESGLAAWLADRPGATATPRAADMMALATRPAKNQSRSFGSLRDEWRARAQHVGLSPDVVVSWMGRSRPVPMPEIAAMAAELLAPDGLASRQGYFGRRELLRAVVEALPQGAEVQAVESRAAELVAWAGLVERPASPARPPERWRGRDGRAMVSGVVEARWTTPALAGAEATLVEAAHRRGGDGAGLVEVGTLAGALAERPQLGSLELAQVQRLVGAGAGIDILLTGAGPSRGDVLDAARGAWQASGWRVEGVASTAGAARSLEAATGIQSQSLGAYLDGPIAGPATRTVLVAVDAERLSLDQLASLLGRAGPHKVVLVGDPSRGGPAEVVLHGMAGRLGVADRLAEAGVAPVPAGAAVTASVPLDQARLASVPLGPAGHVTLAPTAAGARRALVEDWWSATGRGERPTMVAPGPGEAALLNREARARLRAAGRLGETLPGTGSDLAVGDRVMPRWTRPGWDLAAGTEATVVGLGPGGQDLRLCCEGRETSVPLAGLRPSQLVHAYALTPADARRRGPDRTLVLGGPEVLSPAGPGPDGSDSSRRSFYLVDTGTLAPSPARGAADRLLGLARPATPPGPVSGAAPGVTRDPPGDMGRELDRLRRDLLRSLPADPGPALAAIAEEREVVARGLAQARMAQSRADESRADGSRGKTARAEPGRAAQARAGAAALVERWEAAAGRLGVRQAEVEAMVRGREEWVVSRGQDLTRYRTLTEAVELRSRALVRAAEIAPGAHVLEALGPRPEGLAQRGAWQEGVAAIESWREQWGGPDPALPLGPEAVGASPRDVEAIVERSRRRLGRGRGPERAAGLELQR